MSNSCIVDLSNFQKAYYKTSFSFQEDGTDLGKNLFVWGIQTTPALLRMYYFKDKDSLSLFHKKMTIG